MKLKQIYQAFLTCTGVSSDTRTIQEGNLFVALKGPNFNANSKAQEALENGAIFVLVDDETVVANDSYLLVEDCLSTLQDLAKLHRTNMSNPVIGITGSNGKTTTKELIKQVLDTKYHVLSTVGNYNNHIGVPLTILNSSTEADMWIVEMGANQPGDIAFLCDIAMPDFGVITNVGLAHLELLQGPEGVYVEKTALFESVKRSEGHIFLNEGDPYLRRWVKKKVKKTLYSSDEIIGYELMSSFNSNQKLVCNTKDVGGVEKEYILNITGEYNMMNIAAAVSIGAQFDISVEDGLTAITKYVPQNQRSQIITTTRNEIVADSYNANPSSMKASIHSFYEQNKSKKSLLILGDMLELGDQSLSYHEEIVAYVESLGLDFITVGPIFSKIEVAAGNNFESTQSLIKSRQLKSVNDTVVLVKGSRGIRLEQLFDFL